MWPDSLLLPFKHAESDDEYIDSYNKLLTALFPKDSTDCNIFRDMNLPCPRNEFDQITTLSVHLVRANMSTWTKSRVLILDLRPPSYLESPLACKQADEEIRQGMLEELGACPLPTLYGVSAMGTKLRFYTLNKTGINNEVIIAFMSGGSATADKWNVDLLKPDGEAKMRELAGEIVDGCAGLQ